MTLPKSSNLHCCFYWVILSCLKGKGDIHSKKSSKCVFCYVSITNCIQPNQENNSNLYFTKIYLPVSLRLVMPIILVIEWKHGEKWLYKTFCVF